MDIITHIITYFYQLIKSWILWLFVILDAVGALLTYYSDLSIKSSYYSGFLILGFIFANLKLYIDLKVENAELERIISEYENAEANIKLEIVVKEFGHSHGSRPKIFKNIKSNPHGFDKNGIPDWGSLWVKLKASNTGYKEGKLAIECDDRKIKLPSLFNIDEMEIGFENPFIKINPQTEITLHLYIDIPFTDKNPETFSKAIKAIIEDKEIYEIPIKYWTERIGDNSEPQELIIEGDFSNLYLKLLERWESYNHKDLADWVRVAEWAEPLVNLKQ